MINYICIFTLEFLNLDSQTQNSNKFVNKYWNNFFLMASILKMN